MLSIQWKNILSYKIFETTSFLLTCMPCTWFLSFVNWLVVSRGKNYCHPRSAWNKSESIPKDLGEGRVHVTEATWLEPQAVFPYIFKKAETI